MSHLSVDPGSIAGVLLFSAVGIGFAIEGATAIIKREITAGRKKSPHHIVIYGKKAVLMGLGVMLFGLYFSIQGILITVKSHRLH
ncbi:MAG TPA: hypothetical protein VNV60_07685 [Holophagaceae bacterium]|nr:hypothetical protein [Holophagaceae bacterium]